MNQSKSIKISAAIAGTILFLAFLLRSTLISDAIFQFMPVWLLLIFIVINIILYCIPKLRERRSIRIACQLGSVVVAVIVLLCL